MASRRGEAAGGARAAGGPAEPAPAGRRGDPPGGRRAQTRRRLIDAALDVFAARGFHGASVDDVARAAGFSIGALYSNFAGKDELLLAVADEHIAWLDLVLDEAPATGDPRAWATATDDWPRQFRIFVELWSYGVRDDRMRDELADRMREMRRIIAAAIHRTAERTGHDLPLPPDQLAVVAVAVVRGVAFERSVDPSAVPDEMLTWLVERLSA